MKSHCRVRSAARLLTILLIAFDLASIAAALSHREPRRRPEGPYVIAVAVPVPTSEFTMRVHRPDSSDGNVMPCLAPIGAEREAYAALLGPVPSPCRAAGSDDHDVATFPSRSIGVW